MRVCRPLELSCWSASWQPGEDISGAQQAASCGLVLSFGRILESRVLIAAALSRAAWNPVFYSTSTLAVAWVAQPATRRAPNDADDRGHLNLSVDPQVVIKPHDATTLDDIRPSSPFTLAKAAPSPERQPLATHGLLKRSHAAGPWRAPLKGANL
ncbi:hypothetical protein PspLS_00274 [Pyricularia sp. CBS 133598]|nr:hypothetical protein PspLS_00274 [Pyricularia sp. CBS 133598]